MHKKNKIALNLFILIGIITLIVGCRTEPICNFINNSVVQYNERANLEQVKNAILKAGKDLGWKMEEKNKNLIMGTLNLRGHQAVVKINYGIVYYSIMYVSSKNLDYDNYSINRFYNSWVTNLEHKINSNLANTAK
jgi:hypothetical protein